MENFAFLFYKFSLTQSAKPVIIRDEVYSKYASILSRSLSLGQLIFPVSVNLVINKDREKYVIWVSLDSDRLNEMNHLVV